MPVELKRPVARKTRNHYSTLYVQPRQIIVTLMPGDVIEFREHGRRSRWLLAVDTAFKYAVRLATFAQAAAKRRIKR
jgi:hypothetical protein